MINNNNRMSEDNLCIMMLLGSVANGASLTPTPYTSREQIEYVETTLGN